MGRSLILARSPILAQVRLVNKCDLSTSTTCHCQQTMMGYCTKIVPVPEASSLEFQNDSDSEKERQKALVSSWKLKLKSCLEASMKKQHEDFMSKIQNDSDSEKERQKALVSSWKLKLKSSLEARVKKHMPLG